MPEFSSDLARAAEVIGQGGIVLCPAEGVYGLSCAALNDDAVRRVIVIKERDDSKGLITMGDSVESLGGIFDFAALPEKARSLMTRLWPGPYTFVVPCAPDLHGKTLTGGRDTVAVRVTAFETMAELCRLCGTALVSTSANLSGMEAVSEFDELSPIIMKRVDLVLELPCGGLRGSTSIYDTVAGKLVRRGPQWPEELK